MMELEVWDTLRSVVEEEVSDVEASILSSVVDVGVVPRPELVPAGSLQDEEEVQLVSTVYTADLLQPSPAGCSRRYSTFSACDCQKYDNFLFSLHIVSFSVLYLLPVSPQPARNRVPTHCFSKSSLRYDVMIDIHPTFSNK